MNILFLSNNNISSSLFNWLKSCSPNDHLFFESEPLTNEKLNIIKPFLVISFLYKHIISFEILNNKQTRFINLHPSFLPYNRGADPNIWSILENTPKGVSIHLISSEIDTGDILAQKLVHFDQSVITLADSYNLLILELENLFKTNWQMIRNNAILPSPQIGKGTFHLKKEFQEIKKNVLGMLEWDISIEHAKENYRRLKIQNEQ